MNDFEALSLFQVEEVKLVYSNKIPPDERITVNSSSLAYEVFMAAWDMDKIELQEQAMILLLDHSLQCLGVANLATGSIGSVMVDQRLLFATALKARAISFIFAHNHPTMVLKPSQQDISMTEQLCTSGGLLDISCKDHLIIRRDGYYSFADNGILPEPGRSQKLRKLRLM